LFLLWRGGGLRDWADRLIKSKVFIAETDQTQGARIAGLPVKMAMGILVEWK
jgi:hypothetical protein